MYIAYSNGIQIHCFVCFDLTLFSFQCTVNNFFQICVRTVSGAISLKCSVSWLVLIRLSTIYSHLVQTILVLSFVFFSLRVIRVRVSNLKHCTHVILNDLRIERHSVSIKSNCFHSGWLSIVIKFWVLLLIFTKKSLGMFTMVQRTRCKIRYSM